MTTVSPGRRAALEILEAVERGRRLDLALDEAFSGGGPEELSPDDRAWAHACAYGTIRLQGRLDHLLERFVDRGLSSLPRQLVPVLRMGAYQLLYMGGVPDYATLSQTVELGKEVAGQRMGGVVNGVLRTLQREAEAGGSDGSGGSEASDGPSTARGASIRRFFPDPASDSDADRVEFLSTWGSHPRWLVERWLERYGYEGARDLVEWDNEPPPLYIRPVGITPEDAVEALAASGIGAEVVGRGTGSVRIEGGADPGRVLAVVPAVVQDPGASLVAAYAAPEPGSTVADLCAAPGGKALVLAGAVGPSGRVVAGDFSPSRLSMVRESVRRLAGSAGGAVGGDGRDSADGANGAGMGPGIAPVYTVVARGEIPPVAGADLVLLDVPCSGTGTLRRHPDGRWRLDPGDVERMADIQRRILEGGADAVRPGGLLVYSTCTLEPEENEGVVRAFLESDGRFEMEPPGTGAPQDPGTSGGAPGARDLQRLPLAAAGEFVDDEGFLRVLPHASWFDGAFAARMRRTG